MWRRPMTDTHSSGTMRREFIKVAAGTTTVAGIAGCLGGGGGAGDTGGGTGSPTPSEGTGRIPSSVISAAQEEEQLSVYATISQSDLNEFFKPVFEERYPWAEVDFQNFGSAELASKIISEKRTGNVTADVVSISRGTSLSLVGQDVFRSIGEEHFLYQQSAEMGYPEEFYTQGIMLPGYGLPYTLLYNTDHISEAEAPDSWEGLGDDQWTGQSGIVMQHPSQLSSTGGLFATLWGMWGEEKWRNVVADIMDNNPQLGTSNSQSYRVMIQGERTLSPNYVNDLILQVKQGENPPAATKWLDPSLMVTVPTNLVQDAPHPNLAEVFVSWFISEEGQELIGNTGTWPMHAPTADGHPDLERVIPSGTEIRPQAFNNPTYQGEGYLENPNAWVPLFNEAFGSI